MEKMKIMTIDMGRARHTSWVILSFAPQPLIGAHLLIKNVNKGLVHPLYGTKSGIVRLFSFKA